MIHSKISKDVIENILKSIQVSRCASLFSLVLFSGRPEPQFSYSNLVVGNFKENIDEGKTYEWFKWASKISKSRGTDYIFKMDTDTIINWCRLSEFLQSHDVRFGRYPHERYVYIGRLNDWGACGKFEHCPPPECQSFSNSCWIYMSGGFYGLSHSLLNRILESRYTHSNIIGPEDLLVGRWISKLSMPEKIHIFNVPNGDLWCHSLNKEIWSEYALPKRWEKCEK